MTSLLFRQLFDGESSTYSYLLADPKTRAGVLIDPVLEQTARDIKLLRELGIRLKYILDTHVHADHITGASALRELTGARVGVGEASGVRYADIKLADGESLLIDSFRITALSTPGHTSGCTSYYTPGMVFTGDALFIRGTGRTDFQQGSAETLFDSIHQKLFTLPDETLVFPGHDYNGQTASTVQEERLCNPRVRDAISKLEFVRIMQSLKLPPPKRLNEAVPANLNCGRTSLSPTQ